MQPIPSGLAAMLANGPQQGPPQTIQVDPSQHPDNQKLAQQLEAVITGLHAAMQSPQSDPVVGLDLRKAEMAIAKVLADLHKEQQAAMGGGPATNFLRRNSGGQ